MLLSVMLRHQPCQLLRRYVARETYGLSSGSSCSCYSSHRPVFKHQEVPSGSVRDVRTEELRQRWTKPQNGADAAAGISMKMDRTYSGSCKSGEAVPHQKENTTLSVNKKLSSFDVAAGLCGRCKKSLLGMHNTADLLPNTLATASSFTVRCFNSSCVTLCRPNEQEPKKSETEDEMKTQGQLDEDDDYETVPYKFKVENQKYTWFYRTKLRHILIIRALTRLKIYQTGVTAIVIVPWSIFCGLYDQQQIALIVGFSVFTCMTLFLISNICMRVAGFISLSEDRQTVRVSHLSFWGKREEHYIPVDKIIPLSETPDKFNDVYIKLRQDDSPLTFLYSLRYGEVRDKDTFETVMGMIK